MEELIIKNLEKKTRGIKIESDDLIVKLPKTNFTTQEIKTISLNTKLKAYFEETITSLRTNRQNPELPIDLKIKLNEKLILPELIQPDTKNAHPVLVPLLQIIWKTHCTRLNAISDAFKSALTLKIKNTQILLEFKNDLKIFIGKLLDTIRNESLETIQSDFFVKWKHVLENAQTILKTKEKDVDKLIQICFQNILKTTTLDLDSIQDFSKQQNFAFESMNYKFKNQINKIWMQWKQELEKHTNIFKGKIVDSESESDEEVEEKEQTSKEFLLKQENIEENEFFKLIISLNAMQLDFVCKTSAVDKLIESNEELLQLKLQEKTMSLLSEIISKEETIMNESTSKVKTLLENITKEQKKALDEITRACNNSTKPVESYLKSMQATIDLTLEATKEYLYTKAVLEINSYIPIISSPQPSSSSKASF